MVLWSFVELSEYIQTRTPSTPIIKPKPQMKQFQQKAASEECLCLSLFVCAPSLFADIIAHRASSKLSIDLLKI